MFKVNQRVSRVGESPAVLVVHLHLGVSVRHYC
jgi:hypothetical protein